MLYQEPKRRNELLVMLDTGLVLHDWSGDWSVPPHGTRRLVIEK